MSTSLPHIPSHPRNDGTAPILPPESSEKEIEYLMIRLEHDYANGTTEVAFEGTGFDATNDEIIVDILNTAASVFDYTLVADEDVQYVSHDEDVYND